MSRIPLFSSPLLLGFDELERLLERATKAQGDGHPPYNIERLENGNLRIVVAVAGYGRDELEVWVEDNQLAVRGTRKDNGAGEYLHRGIAGRQFTRTFVLADGLRVQGAQLANGLLSISVERPEPGRVIRRIDIEGV